MSPYREPPPGMPTVEQVRERDAEAPLWKRLTEGMLEQAAKQATKPPPVSKLGVLPDGGLTFDAAGCPLRAECDRDPMTRETILRFFDAADALVYEERISERTILSLDRFEYGARIRHAAWTASLRLRDRVP